MPKIIAIIFFALFSFKSHAQIIDSVFFDWTIYEISGLDDGQRKCYMVTHPIHSQSDHNKRKKPYLMITRYENKRNEEVSIYSGYEYKFHSKVFVAIDNMKFLFATNNDMAWTATPQQDAMIIQKMLNSAFLKIRSNSAIGTFAVDKYSLKGIAKAYRRLKTICD